MTDQQQPRSRRIDEITMWAMLVGLGVALIISTVVLLGSGALAHPPSTVSADVAPYCRNAKAAANHPDCASPTITPSPSTASPTPSVSPTGPSPSPTTASPSPTVSPTPTSTGPCLDALRRADRCGYPTAASTGPRSPVALTNYTGPLPLVIPAGQIRSGLIVPGCVRLQANARLVDSVIRPTASTLCGGYAAIDQEWGTIQQGVIVDSVEVDLHLAGPNRMNIRAITGSGFTLNRVHCWGGADCVHYGAYVTITNSYLHTPPCLTAASASVCGGLHIDALHSASSPVLGALIQVEHNTIVAEENTATNYATSAWINGPDMNAYSGFPQTNVHGINNLLAGGGYTQYCEAHREQASSVPIVEYTGNRFSDLYYPHSGYWGATTDCSPLPNYSTNVWDRTGLPLGSENPR